MSAPTFAFPQSLAEKYRPKGIADFIGLEKPKRVLSKFAVQALSLSLDIRRAVWLGQNEHGASIVRADSRRIAPYPESEVYGRRNRKSLPRLPLSSALYWRIPSRAM